MDNNTLLGSLFLGIIVMAIWFYFLEQVIISAMKKYKKWEIEEMKNKEK